MRSLLTAFLDWLVDIYPPIPDQEITNRFAEYGRWTDTIDAL